MSKVSQKLRSSIISISTRVQSEMSEISHKLQTSNISISTEDIHTSCMEFSKMGNEVKLNDLKSETSAKNLLSHCHHHDDKTRQYAAKMLTKLIQKDITTFYSSTHLQTFEKEVRHLIENRYVGKCEMSNEFERLYIWILAAIYIKIYKYNDCSLKAHMKASTLKKYKTTQKPFEEFCRKSYYKLIVSLLARIKTWPNRLDKNDLHIQILENCLPTDKNQFGTGTQMNMTMSIKCFKDLPWDIKHIFVVLLTEKIFEKKYTEPDTGLFVDICNSVWKKHTDIFLEVIERVTEYIEENCTKGILGTCLQLLNVFLGYLKVGGKEDEKLVLILRHFFKKLVYHPFNDVRKLIAQLIFNEEINGIDICQLGSTCINVSNHLVEKCIREKLSSVHPDLVFKDQVQTISNALIFKVETSGREALIHVLKQETLNDVLQTNSTDENYECFKETLAAVEKCKGHENIVQLLNMSSNGILPYYMVEHGTPLLHFLHEKESQLTWSDMIDILIDITEAVNHCHNNSVIHRDITPASFEAFTSTNGSFRTKLAHFLYAKCTVSQEAIDPGAEYIDVFDYPCFQGDHKESVAAYFSAPETLAYNIFSKCTDIWMVAATFYSVLLYGRQPFEELAHLTLCEFIREINSGHKAEIPNSISTDLWNIVQANLDFSASKRMLIETLLHELKSYKAHLGAKKDIQYTAKSVCEFINPEDIQRGYLDKYGYFTLEKKNESMKRVYKDSCKRTDHLCQTVSVRMNQRTRKKIKALTHPNILQVAQILKGPYTTTLVYHPFGKYSGTLNKQGAEIKMDQLLSYFHQLTSALEELHTHNILHCDLRCSHIYLNLDYRTLKLGHFGRAISLEDKWTSPYIFKVMPLDAEKWSALEVRVNGMYSFASDVYNLAIVFWETMNSCYSTDYVNQFVKQKKHGTKDGYSILFSDPKNYCMNRLMACMYECWSANPTKRPSLGSIKETIKQLQRCYEEYGELAVNDTSGCSISQSSVYDYQGPQENEDYFSVRETSCRPLEFSLTNTWERVVYELVFSKGIVKNTTNLIDIKETPEYQDVGINPNRTKKNTSILL
ncbi:uncharacterized protein LOC134574475 [Pelobates fuscus]|uniref:uncharacterized protein LOC134574475 n=1 Tax=Pelobates fuscus TaxID=191477 RepID=UPI002FE4583B